MTDMMELASRIIELEGCIKDKDAELKELRSMKDELSQQLVSEMLDNELQSINKSGKTLYLKNETYASYKKEIQDTFFSELTAHGMDAIIKPTINPRTLKSSIQELIENNNGDLPDWLDGLVDIYTETKLNIRKSN